MVFAEELFSKRFGFPNKEGEKHCFLDMSPHKADKAEANTSPLPDFKVKPQLRNGNVLKPIQFQP